MRALLGYVVLVAGEPVPGCELHSELRDAQEVEEKWSRREYGVEIAEVWQRSTRGRGRKVNS